MVCLISWAIGAAPDKSPSSAKEHSSRIVSFNDDIRPIFNQNCVGCHGGVKMAGEVSFIYRHLALGKGESGKRVIVPGEPQNSEIMRRLTSSDPDDLMPPPEHGPSLSDKDIGLIRTWIEQGANWEVHWAFDAPKPQKPPVTKLSWGNNRIDSLTLAEMEQRKLTPSPPASPAELLRRMSYDLTGLPPSIEDLDRFIAACAKNRKQAIDHEIDRLLASPAYGERWASVWMDLARYADSEGLGADRKRDVWPYRDWLIRSFNNDIPFDQFTIKQLAGDLLENPSYDDRIATVFHRLTQANEEGGTDDEEFRTVAVMDRASTTWEVWQGQTFGCVQCHSHPYDTFEHKEYYNFLAFFNNNQDNDTSSHYPTLRVPSKHADYQAANNHYRQFKSAEKNYHLSGHNFVKSTQWHNTKGSTVKSKRSKSKVTAVNDIEEIHTEGTVASRTHFDVTWEPETTRIDAVRINIIPKDIAAAKSLPENGSVLSYAELRVTRADGKVEKIPFQHIIPDSTESSLNPRLSLSSKSSSGWGPFSKIYHPRWAVLVPKSPVKLSAGSKVTLHLQYNSFYLAGFVMVPHRSSISYSGDPKWDNWRSSATELFSQFSATSKAYRKTSGPSIPVIQQRDTTLPRKTHVFKRGNWLEKGELVEQANTPAAFPKLKTQGKSPTRLDMARWLASTENPLTARIAVNRYWHQLFGRGIVETLEDFGSAGMKPTNQALLDDLAVRFQTDYKWSNKAILREIVSSATYQQTATASVEKRAKDPENIWLSYSPRRRLQAEAVRDMGLVVSGLISNTLYGKPAYPPIPPGVWKPFSSGDKWNTPAIGNPERYRRSLYTYWKRSIPYPALMSFDTPTREVCSKRRLMSNTPVAALTTLNDVAFAEFAQGLARRMKYDCEGSLQQKIAFGYRVATSKNPRPETLKELVLTFQDIEQSYKKNPKQMAGMAGTADGAAYTVIASLILNLDATLSK